MLLQPVLNRYPSVFQKGLGTPKGFKARIYVDPDAQPRFHPARSVPYAFREKVDKELQRLQDEGTLEPIEFAEWAAPIVAVLKSDKSSIRICGDFSVTINPVDRYPIPKVEEFFTRLKKGKYFQNSISVKPTSKFYYRSVTIVNSCHTRANYYGRSKVKCPDACAV